MNHLFTDTARTALSTTRWPVRFPVEASRRHSDGWRLMTGRRLDADRRIEALASRFNCLGHFTDGPGPRAA